MCADNNLNKHVINKKDLLSVFLVAVGFFTYFLFTTESEYRFFPKGDARVYTLMTLHFNAPGAVGEKLPIMYSQRLVPAMAAYVFAYPELQRHKAELKTISTQEDTQRIESVPLNRIVLSAWLESNFFAYLLQLFLLVVIVSYLGGSPSVRLFVLVVYSMWFLSARLYINWAQMPDPWAFTFLLAAAYFILKRNSAGFLISVLLGVMCKEMVLLLVPAYAWRLMSGERTGRRYAEFVAVSILPFAFFFFLRAYPYFPSKLITPNLHQRTDYSRILTGKLSDYLLLVNYHYRFRSASGLRYLIDTLIIPFGVFSGVSYFLAWRIKDVWGVLKGHKYWLPYVALVSLVGLNVDRYIFYIFPVVIFLSSIILERNYSGGKRVCVMLFIILLTLATQDFFVPVTEATAVSLKHQLEISSVMRPVLAWKFRVLIIAGAVAAFGGFFVLERVFGKEKGITGT